MLVMSAFLLLLSNALTLALALMTLGGGIFGWAVEPILEGTLQGSLAGGLLRKAEMGRGKTLVGKFALYGPTHTS